MKNLLMKSIMILSLIILVCSFSFAQDEDAEHKIFEKPSLEIGSVFSTSVSDSMESELTFQAYAKGSLPLKLVKDYYTLTPWVKERFDLSYSGPDYSASTIGVSPMNRFYLGLDNAISIPDVINIGANFAVRLQSKFVEPGLHVQLNPALTLGGSYDFGLSWDIGTLFYINLEPHEAGIAHADIDGDGHKYYDDDSDKGRDSDYEEEYDSAYAFKSLGIEIDSITLQFEFFHFFAPKDVKCKFKINFYLPINIVPDAYQKAYAYHNAGKASYNLIGDMDLYVGLNFDLWGFTPYIGGYFVFTQHQNARDVTAQSWKTQAGIKTGIGFSKDWLSISIDYKGKVIVGDTDPDVDPIKIWSNYIEGSFSISL